MAKPLEWYRQKTPHTSISGISEARRLPRLGKIRQGVKATTAAGKEYPKEVEYFVCPPEVQKVYGEKPKELKVFIPTEDREMFFPQSLRWYKGARLVCRGDGKTATRIDEEKGTMFSLDCTCEHYVGNGGKDCFPRASLMVMLPEVSMSGCYQIDTGSVTAMVSLNSSIDYLQNFLLGRIAFVPLILKREAQKIQTPDGKVVTKHLLALEFRGTIEDVARLRMKDAIQALVAPQMAALPPAPHDAIEEDDAIVVNGHGSTLPPKMEFPDQLPPMDTAKVDAAHAKVMDMIMENHVQGIPEDLREPGMDEEEPFPQKEYVPYQEPPEIENRRVDTAPVPEQVEKARQRSMEKAAEQKQQGIMDRIAMELINSTSKDFLNARWSELVVKNKSLTANQKVDLQKVYMDALKKLKK